MRVAIYGRKFDVYMTEVLQSLVRHLERNEATVAIEEDFYRMLEGHVVFGYEPTVFRYNGSGALDADYLLSVGGDGTMLDTIMLVRDSGIPVLGINTGRLGFLSGVAFDQIGFAIRSLKEQRFKINSRSLLELHTEQSYFGKMNCALNEVSIHRRSSPSLIAIEVWIDEEFVNAYWADGLLVCTPTGSTGYSLSCGGPIIYPQANTMMITPIATHNLTVRPLVIPDTKRVSVRVDAKYGQYITGLDARYTEVTPGERLTIKRAPYVLNIIQFADEEFFSTIREKLKWGLDNRN